MAKESGRKKSPNQLSAEIARSRELVEWDLRELRAELDIPSKIRKSFRRKPGLWIAGIVAVGVLLALRPARKRRSEVAPDKIAKTKTKLLEAGFALGALRIAATLFKPMIMKFVTQKVRDYTASKYFTRK
jgi:hypothetical protein